MKAVVAFIVSALPVLFLLLALAFRATFYWSIQVPEGEPKGGGEILEFLLLAVLLISCGIATFFALIVAAVPCVRDLRLAARTGAIAVASPAIYFLLHPLVPRLM